MLIEPDCTYHNSMEMTEDEVAFKLLKGEMEDVRNVYDQAAAVEETLANIAVAGESAKRLNDRMLGEIDTQRAVGKLLEWAFIDGLSPTPTGEAVTRHFLSPDDAFRLLDAIRNGLTPHEIVAEQELADEEL
jgi:helicase